MNFLEKLSSIVSIKVDISSLKDFSVKLIDFGKGNKFSLITVENNKKEILLNISAKELEDPEVRKRVQSLVYEEVANESRPVLEAEVSDKLIQIEEEQRDDNELIAFFEGKIPAEDMKVFKSALYLRKISGPGVSIDRYLSEIRYKYGQHGANIVHLCTAGYFESYIAPMYEELSARPNFKEHHFLENYNLIIDNVPIAVFVKRADTLESLLTQVTQKLNFNRGYGLKKLHLHAIGHENVQKVNQLLLNEELRALFTEDPSIVADGTLINATIYC